MTSTMHSPQQTYRPQSCLWRVAIILLVALLSTSAASSASGFSPRSYQWQPTVSSQEASSPAIDMGTTLVAVKFDGGGVVVGADTRTSAGGYVSNKMAFKINIILEDKCVICRSGSAADTQHIAGKVKRKFMERQLQRPLYEPSISQVAHLIQHMIRKNVNKDGAPPLQASLICAGYDDNGEGKIYGIAPGGTLWEEEHFCVSGSGSTLLLGMLDAKVKEKEGLFTKEEAVELVEKLLQLSIARDGSSGGLIRIVVMDETGMEQQTIYPSFEKEGEKDGSSKELAGFAPSKRA